MLAMLLQAGVETCSAMAVELADYTASADKAYEDAEPTVRRMDEWPFSSLEDDLAVITLTVPFYEAGRGGSMAKSRLRRMHPRWLEATTPKRLNLPH